MSAKLIASVRQAAVDRFPMPLGGLHGPAHWDRVHENAVYLAKHSRGDLLVAALFAYLHDSCRESDGADAAHGARAARFAASLRGNLLTLDDERFEVLHFACQFHEQGKVSDDPTIGACWDADRLDLGRVGIRPDPKLLSTDRAKRPAVINWGYKRSRGHQATLKS